MQTVDTFTVSKRSFDESKMQIYSMQLSRLYLICKTILHHIVTQLCSAGMIYIFIGFTDLIKCIKNLTLIAANPNYMINTFSSVNSECKYVFIYNIHLYCISSGMYSISMT